MNIKDLYSRDRHENGAEMQLKDEFGSKVDLFITVKGVDSRSWKKASLEMRRSALQGTDPEDTRAHAVAACTIGWRGFVDDDGNEIPFSVEKVEILYDEAPYILDQIDLFMAQRENFITSKDAN